MAEGRVVFEDEKEEKISIQYPCFELKDIVDYYFEIRTPQTAVKPFSIVALPNINMVVSIYLTAQSQIFKIHHKQGASDVSGDKIGGSLTEAITIVHAPGTHEFSIKLKPGVLHAYLAGDLHNLIDNCQPLQQYVNQEYIDAAKSKTTFHERVQYVERLLLTHLKNVEADFKLKVVSKAIYYATNNADYKLNSIVKLLNVSIATLNRYFKEVIGLPPKQCFKALRFKDALKNYRSRKTSNLYDELGYTDFSHFVKEAKELTNKTPSAL